MSCCSYLASLRIELSGPFRALKESSVPESLLGVAESSVPSKEAPPDGAQQFGGGARVCREFFAPLCLNRANTRRIA